MKTFVTVILALLEPQNYNLRHTNFGQRKLIIIEICQPPTPLFPHKRDIIIMILINPPLVLFVQCYVIICNVLT